MQHALQSLVGSVSSFTQAFGALLDASVLAQLWQQQGPKPRGHKPGLSGPQLVSALVFHVLAGAGTLAAHVQQLTGLKLSDSALSQRRTAAGVGVFEAIIQAALRPLAVWKEHPQAFYHGWRLVGMDGSQCSVSNRPQLLGRLRKAASRRLRAAFAKVPMSWLMELGTHAPLAAVVGTEQESEWELSHRLLSQLQSGWLVLADRLYGVSAFVNELFIATQRMGSHFLVRVRQNVKVSVRQVLSDGSALVAVAVADPWHPHRKHGCIWVREIVGRVRRANGSWVSVRLWTDLWDERQHPAAALLALYAQRWEIELGTREWKLDLRGGVLLQSHTVETAAQEILAAVLAMAVLSQARLAAAARGEVGPLRISFGQTLLLVRSLWWLVAVGQGILSARQVLALTERTIAWIAAQALPKRRPRSCPRAVRQPVGRWPRLVANSYQHGSVQYEVLHIAPV
ncbi:MAG: IS4 family transposase [Verrucomicrobia bacterium]|nr:IS4 family transposase [Verrucomicrobiota bacterium]